MAIDIEQLISRTGLLLDYPTQQQVLRTLMHMDQQLALIARQGGTPHAGGAGGGGGISGAGGGPPVSALPENAAAIYEREQKDAIDKVQAAKNAALEEEERNTLAMVERVKGIRSTIMGSIFGSDQGPGAITGQPGGIERLVAGLKSKVFGALPAGGLMGLMLYGASERYQADVVGQTLIQPFEQVGPITGQMAREVGDEIRRLRGLGHDLQQNYAATFSALAQGGLAAADAWDKAATRIGGKERSITDVAIQIEAAFDLAAGSVATAAVEISRSTGEGPNSAIQTISRLGAISRETGANMQQLLGNVTQAAQGLRMQQADASGLVDVYEQLLRVQGQYGGRAARQTQGAMESLQGIASRIPQLSLGYQAVLGQEIARSQGQNLSPEDAVMAFRRGFRGPSGAAPNFDFITTALGRLTDLVGRTATTDFARTQMFMSQGFSQKEAMDLSSLIESKMSGTLGALTAEQTRLLEKALTGEPKNPIETAINALQLVTARTGEALFSLIAGGFRAVVMLLQASVALAAGESKSSVAARLGLGFASVERQVIGSLSGLTEAFKGLGEQGGTVGALLGVMPGEALFLPDDPDAPRRERELQARRASKAQRELGISARGVTGSVRRETFSAESFGSGARRVGRAAEQFVSDWPAPPILVAPEGFEALEKDGYELTVKLMRKANVLPEEPR